MKKQWVSRSGAVVCTVTTLLVTVAYLAMPTFAQQNGTDCPSSYEYGGITYTLTLDSVCNSEGEPEAVTYGGWGARDACYDSNGYDPGQNAYCDPCPSNWQNCTPCPNNEPTCGEHTPDPPPDGGGSLYNRFVDFLDRLTA